MKRGIALLIVGLGSLSIGLMPLNIFAQEGHEQSGITGQVFISVCPVVRLGENCDRPFSTGITVVTDDGRFVTHLVTDGQGRFDVFLKPGDYVLVPDGAGQATFPHVETLAVRVEQKSFTPVTIVYDSGIR